jgi:hypothetical protein
MSTFDDDEIEFDFFDEPETQEATQRRRLPRLERPRSGNGDGGERPPRPPIRLAPGFTPLLRLLLLVVLFIFVVVVLVSWVHGCQGADKRARYEHYMADARTLAQGSATIGRMFSGKLTTPGIRAPALADAVDGFTQQAQQQVTQANKLHPPGPLRPEQSDLVESLQLRYAGLSRFADALRSTAGSKDTAQAGALLAAQAKLLTASDVVWQYFFHDNAVDVLKSQDVTGVSVPPSAFISNPDLVTTSSMVQLVQSFHGASTGGTPSGKHGDGLVSVKALPQGITLSTSQATTVRASTDLAFQVAVQNQGCCREVQVPVTLTIAAQPKPIVLRKTITIIEPQQTTTVTFTNIGQPPFGAKTDIKVVVAPVPGEQTTTNNSATYPVFFSIG